MALGRKTGGRQPGSLNKVTQEVRLLASDYGEAAIEELARLAADDASSAAARVAACNALLDRGFGKSVVGRPIEIELPDTSTVEGVAKAVAAVIKATASGELTPGEAQAMCALLEVQRRVLETSDLEARFTRLEALIEGRRVGEPSPAYAQRSS